MGKRALLRKLLTLSAAYALAVQSVLLGFAASSNAHADPPGVLCVGGDINGAPFKPAQNGPAHNTDCCLATGCCVSHGLTVGFAAQLSAIARPHVAARLVMKYRAPDTWPSERSRSSRAPPV